MNLAMMRGMLEQVTRRRRSYPWSSPPSEVPHDDSSSAHSGVTQLSESSDDYRRRNSKPPSDAEMLKRARDAHNHIDFKALAAGPNAGGPWKRVQGADRFVIFRETDSNNMVPEVLCAGRLDAAIEEVVSILCPRTEAEHNAVMTALHSKRFLLGSLERSISCTDGINNQEESGSRGEQLTVKTSSFARSTLLGSNEQWCYTDFFQRKNECDGFTICQRSLGHDEPTPARIGGAKAHVDQLHDLTAAYLVDLDPGGKGLRVIYNTKFLDPKSIELSESTRESDAIPNSLPADGNTKTKAQGRRLLVLAQGVTKLPELVRGRRFGFQIPADLDAIQVSNPRCPCCTRSLSPVKLSLSSTASAIRNRNLASLKTDTRRCYLCGYLVCVDCWTGERMQSMSGRIASIVVCRRCRASVDACDYSDISVDREHGPARVVEDPPESTKASLLVDFLADSLARSSVGSAERSNVFMVIRTLLHQDEDSEDAASEDSDDDLNTDNNNDDARERLQCDAEAVANVDQFLRDEQKFPLLEACTLGNAERRSYVLDLPDDPKESVPRGPIPDNEGRRLSAAKAAGLLQLADQVAPSERRETESDNPVDVHDLELICQLAAMTLGCSDAMISVMSSSHEHVLASTNVNFIGAAVPRDYTMCQHQLMSQDPLVLIHPEADVRLQAIGTIKQMSLRSYIGFPVTAPVADACSDLNSQQIAVGTLCCLDSKPHAELTRSQYSTLQNLARTASQLVQMKGLQLQQHAAPAS
ncbi:unnamed protein product [Phytophthora lilii]|uniref:Unnamed protein product n=1 Tax=Phytophthora lilii TaxID=2077276 RepID=A0A9W6U5E0_9STRA|nr:unnamed protein product [Phytophthora lilii]